MRRPSRATALAIGLGTILVVLGAVPAAAQAPDGAEVYQSTCAACHQADARGVPGAFPPLAGNPKAGDSAHVTSVVRNGLSGPIEVLGETYDGVMPAVSLTDAELEALIGYLATLSGAAPTDGATTTTSVVPAAADAATGEDLFIGRLAFSGGGPACMSCHVAGPIGHLGGSGLGPDLTMAASRLGGTAGLSAWLAAPPSPTMAPIYADKPLTPDEIGNLAAFLETAPTASAARSVDLLWLAGSAGAAGLFGLMALVLRGRGKNYLQRVRSAT